MHTSVCILCKTLLLELGAKRAPVKILSALLFR